MMRTLCAVLFSCVLSLPAFALDWPSDHTRTIILDNRCRDAMKVIVTHSPIKDVWEKAGWFELQPGDRQFPVHNGARLRHRDTASILLYARSIDDRFEIKGDHGTNFAGEHVKSYKTSRLLRGGFVEVRINCK